MSAKSSSSNAQRVADSRRKAANKGYRVNASSSSVDESLFGFEKPRSAPVSQPQTPVSNFFMGESSSSTRPRTMNNSLPRQPETIQLVTKDLIRTVRVPQDNMGSELILSREEFDRIKMHASVKSQEQLRREREEQVKEYERRMQEADSHRQMLRTTQKFEPSELDKEAAEKNQHTLQNARLMMEEQEDEIKKLNEMILSAKCHAIREAQLAEKAAIMEEYKMEQRRLDEMMEIDRVRALKEYEDREMKIKSERMKGAGEIRTQIHERELQQLIDEELKERETQALLERMKQLEIENQEAERRSKEKAKVLLQAAEKANKEAISIKLMQEEAAKEEDRKIMQFIQDKAEREKELEREREEQRKAKEYELALLRSKQAKAQDLVAQKHELNAKRQQEELERQLRRKEAEEAEKRQRVAADLELSRQQQLRAKEQFMAVQQNQEKEEFLRVLRAQQEMIIADEEKAKREAEHRDRFAVEIQKQIKEKEAVMKDDRKAFFEEGVKLDLEAQARRQRLDEIKHRKLQELEASGLEDKYVNQVRRLVDSPHKQTFSSSVRS